VVEAVVADCTAYARRAAAAGVDPRNVLVDPVAELCAACLDAVDWPVADRPGPVLVLAPERTAHEPTGTLRGPAIADHLLHGCGHRGRPS
jgi:hypothetical protein